VHHKTGSREASMWRNNNINAIIQKFTAANDFAEHSKGDKDNLTQQQLIQPDDKTH